MLRVRFFTNTVLDAGERDLERDLERTLDFDLERDLDLDTERIRMSASLPLRDAISAVRSHFGTRDGTTALSVGRALVSRPEAIRKHSALSHRDVSEPNITRVDCKPMYDAGRLYL